MPATECLQRRSKSTSSGTAGDAVVCPTNSSGASAPPPCRSQHISRSCRNLQPWIRLLKVKNLGQCLLGSSLIDSSEICRRIRLRDWKVLTSLNFLALRIPTHPIVGSDCARRNTAPSRLAVASRDFLVSLQAEDDLHVPATSLVTTYLCHAQLQAHYSSRATTY